MQLPRGTFREIRKHVAIEDLLHALSGEKFSGVVNISSQTLTGTLVFKAGKCILVKAQNNRGDAGWDELQKSGSMEVDAAISLLGDAQINLALEFNKTCRILNSRKQAPAHVSDRIPPSTTREPIRSMQTQKLTAPTAALNPTVKPAPSRSHVPAPQIAIPQTSVHSSPSHPVPFSKAAATLPPSPPRQAIWHEDQKKNETDNPPEREHDTSSLDNDFDTFDTMDFENVTDKIRSDCKTMIKQLHLDHLMEH